VVVEALDDVGDEVRVRYRGANLGEDIGRNILVDEVVIDGEVPLLDVAEFLGEINLVWPPRPCRRWRQGRGRRSR
jgi:hypothetical protein